MFRVLLHTRTIITSLSVAFLVPGVSQAWNITCVNEHDAFECNDGTIITCESEGLVIDCPADMGESACENFGGLRAIKPADGERAEERLIADYHGWQSFPPFTGEGEVNSTVTTTLSITCANGKSFICEETQPSCSPDAIKAQCGAQGTRSIAAQFAFTPFRIR